MANLGCAPHHVNVLKKGSVPTIFSAEQFGTPADCLRQLRAESPGAGPTTTHRPTTPSPRAGPASTSGGLGHDKQQGRLE